MTDSTFNVDLRSISGRERFALDQLATTFGVTSPKQYQAELIVHAVRGHNILAVMPTGWGKSTLYQVPAVALPGTAIVISPLIALMDDQVASLRRMGISAAAIHSGTSPSEYEKTIRDLENGTLKILFNSPKRLNSSANWLERLSEEVKVSLIGVDEAHLIVDWGQSGFVSSYQTVFRKLRKHFPNAPVVATTASATSFTANAILQTLGFQRSDIGKTVQYVRIAPDRPEIALKVLAISPNTRKSRDQDVVDEFKRMLSAYWDGRPNAERGTGIIYTVTQKDAERLSAELSGAVAPLRVPYYHAAADISTNAEETYFASLRNQLEQRTIPAIVATSAAGMGIDIESLRYCIHDGMRTSIEEYWQQVGRLGRTRQPLRDGHCTATLITDELEHKRWSFALERKLPMFVQRAELAFSYSRAPICRKGMIVGYLGDNLGPDCGYCDRCAQTRGDSVMSGDLSHVLQILNNGQNLYSIDDLFVHKIHGVGVLSQEIGDESARAIFVNEGARVEKIVNLKNAKQAVVLNHGYERHSHFSAGNSIAKMGVTACVNGQIDGKVIRVSDVFCEIESQKGENFLFPVGVCRVVSAQSEPMSLSEKSEDPNQKLAVNADSFSIDEMDEEIRRQGSDTSWWRE